MNQLVADMVQDDPAKRPNIDDVVSRFEGIISSLPYWTLRSRLATKREPPVVRIIRSITHQTRTFKHIFTGRKAMPTPSY